LNGPSVALIACSNGLGHVRRLLVLAGALARRGGRPTLFAPRDSVDVLVRAMGVAAPPVEDFSTGTDRAAWTDGRAAAWVGRLSPLERFDHVVSDNLIEILERRPDAWLSGSFFWHRALDGVSPGLAARAEALLARYRPRMIATRLFAAEDLGAATRLHGVGLYAAPGPAVAAAPRDALVACGRGGGISAAAAALVGRIAAGPPPPFATVRVEPGLYHSALPDWIRPADFTPAMYAGLRVAVIRPGIGTVTDSLLAGARLFSFFEDGNAEMRDNAARIAAAGLGESCATADAAWERALAFAGDPTAGEGHRRAFAALDRDGADQAARLILGAA